MWFVVLCLPLGWAHSAQPQSTTVDDDEGGSSQTEKLSIARRPEPPAPPCAACQSTGRRKVEAKSLYILFENDPAPEPSARLGWSPCTDCVRGKEYQAVWNAEKARLADRAAAYRRHEEKVGLRFVNLETGHFTGHFQTTPAEAREAATWLAKLAEGLREQGAAAYLPASPAELQLVICENAARYQAYLEYFVAHVEVHDKSWKELAAGSASFGSQDLAIIRRDRVVSAAGSTLNHLVAFSAAHLLVENACAGKAPDWFAEGFSSYCESFLLGIPCCYSIRYEPNVLEPDFAWAKSLAEALRQGKGREWKIIFNVALIGMTKLEYQECWSIVRYLAQADKEAFARMPGFFKSGLDTTAALEKAYGKPIPQLEAQWRVWACQGR
jgi:hypothetical protein